MKTYLFAVFLVVFVTLSFGSALSNENLRCGIIYDGLTNGRFDIQVQTSHSIMGANWFDFGESVISYEWAIFSDAVPLPANTGSCKRQLQANPDIQSWKNVLKSNSGVNTKLQLQEDRIYFSAVRATFRSGEQLIAISNGVKILPEEKNTKNFNQAKTEPLQKISENIRNPSQDSLTCSLDELNRCRSGSISVSDRLSELYGPPRFPFDDSVDSQAFVGAFVGNGDDDDDSDDDDDNGYVWVIAPVVGVVLLAVCLILLCLLLLFLCTKGLPKGERKEKAPKAAPMEFEDVDESKGYGQREGVETGNVESITQVVFPDTNIRRLSISHQDAPEVGGDSNSPRRGRAPHPIMNSASSSFRDYRSSVNHS